MHSISDTICVARRIILSFESSASILRKLILSFGSSPAVGSSRISIFGSFSKACANSSLCFIPPENCPLLHFAHHTDLLFQYVINKFVIVLYAFNSAHIFQIHICTEVIIQCLLLRHISY